MLASLPYWLAVAATVTQPPPTWTLPDGIRPIAQSLELNLDPDAPKFTGVAKIDVELRSSVDVIWLNGHDLTVSRASISKRPAKVGYAGNEFISLSTGRRIGPGKATLELEYSAPLSDQAKSGPYRRKTGNDWYAFTVFTPINARRAFPCFDEPRFKIPWTVSIKVKPGDNAFANAPQAGETPATNGGGRVIRFAPTQPIPSEVVALTVGPYDIFEGGVAGAKQTPVRILVPKGQREEGRVAADATRHVLPRLEAYTSIPYPWDKLDHVALPEGAFGAVENPGLITYRARSLLPGPDPAPERVRAIQAVEAHELAHQWFGNLVTQATWDDVWLSEGFATWLSSEVMDEDETPARAHLRYIARRVRIMTADDGDKSHPVRNPKHNRSEMDSVYDQFPYQKGAAILLTLESWLGQDKLRDGLRDYLRAHASGNATSADLAASITKTAGVDVKPVLDSMLDHKTVPVVEAKVDCTGPGRPRAVLSTTQLVPVCYRSDVGEGCIVGPPEAALQGCPTWIYWNRGGMGYYHTRWSSTAQLPSLSQLSASERLVLADDLRYSIRTGALKPDQAADILKQLESDPEPEVSDSAKPSPTRSN